MGITEMIQYRLILASKSPRRQHLLGELGLSFSVLDIEHDEHIPDGIVIDDVARFLAVEKSMACPEPPGNSILVTADTIVVLDDHILHKPMNEDEAFRMIRQLAGKCHRVDTGVCLRTALKKTSFTESTTVWFNDLEDDEIRYYVDRFKPLDKAGAYGIQEWIGYIGVNRIEGCYFNVMGLPLSRLYSELKQFIQTI